MEPKFHFPKRTLILIKRPHHEAEIKPDTNEFAATAAAAAPGLMKTVCILKKAVCLDLEGMVLKV